jgi:hypothetical protein
LTGLSFGNAGKLVQRLAELGILSETTGLARHRRFRYLEYLSLFATDEELEDKG